MADRPEIDIDQVVGICLTCNGPIRRGERTDWIGSEPSQHWHRDRCTAEAAWELEFQAGVGLSIPND